MYDWKLDCVPVQWFPGITDRWTCDIQGKGAQSCLQVLRLCISRFLDCQIFIHLANFQGFSLIMIGFFVAHNFVVGKLHNLFMFGWLINSDSTFVRQEVGISFLNTEFLKIRQIQEFQTWSSSFVSKCFSYSCLRRNSSVLLKVASKSVWLVVSSKELY